MVLANVMPTTMVQLVLIIVMPPCAEDSVQNLQDAHAGWDITTVQMILTYVS